MYKKTCININNNYIHYIYICIIFYICIYTIVDPSQDCGGVLWTCSLVEHEVCIAIKSLEHTVSNTVLTKLRSSISNTTSTNQFESCRP